jgi:hypothetical protein
MDEEREFHFSDVVSEARMARKVLRAWKAESETGER